MTFSAEGSATERGVQVTAELENNRHRFGVSYRRVTLRDILVDDVFWLELTIAARSL